MAVTIDIPVGVLRAARREWDAAAETIGTQWRRLHRVSSADLSPPVALAFRVFREAWVDELKHSHHRATAFTEALADADTDFAFADARAAERARALLPWAYRDARLVARPGR